MEPYVHIYLNVCIIINISRTLYIDLNIKIKEQF